MFSQVLKNNSVSLLIRNFSYKPIKRPSPKSTSNSAFVENKLKEYDLAKVFRSKIETSGPITSKKVVY